MSCHEIGNNQFVDRLTIVRGDIQIEKLNLRRIDLIKIDVEGFEKEVLLGLSETIRKHRPFIVLEFSETTRHHFASLNEFMTLFPEGYRASRIVHSHPILVFFNRPGYSLEPFEFGRHFGNLLLEPCGAR